MLRRLAVSDSAADNARGTTKIVFHRFILLPTVLTYRSDVRFDCQLGLGTVCKVFMSYEDCLGTASATVFSGALDASPSWLSVPL